MRRTLCCVSLLALFLSMVSVASTPALASSNVPVGSYPTGLAIDPVTHDVFVGDALGNEVKRIDPVTRTSSSFGPSTFSSPNHLAVDADSRRLYVASSSDVEVLDLSDGHLIASTPVPVGARGVALANGKLFVANNQDASVSIFDATSLTEVGTIPVGARPLGVTSDVGRGIVFVASAFGDSVSVIDAATDEVVHVLSVPTPYDVAFDPGTARLFVASQSAGLFVFDTNTFALTSIASYANAQGDGCCASNLTFAPENNRIYVSGTQGQLAVFDAATLQMLSLEPVGSDPHGVVTDPVTWEVFVANSGDDSVSILPQDVTKPTVAAIAMPGGPEVTHDGDRMARSWRVALECADDQSGCARTAYSVDGAAEVFAPSFDVTQAGTHTITYRAFDNARNVSDAGFVTLAVDATPPATTSSATADAPPSGAITRGSWRIELTCTDFEAGCAQTFWAIDGGEFNPYADAVVLTAEGMHTFNFFSRDRVGNEEELHTMTVGIDATAPTTDGTSQASEPASGSWTRGSWTLRLSCADSTAGSPPVASGCAHTTYEIDQKATQEYFDPIVVDSEGRHLVTTRSIDKVGNIEADVQFPLDVDRSAPHVEMEPTQGVLFASPVLPPTLHAIAADMPLADGSAGSGVEEVCFALMRTTPFTEDLGCINGSAQQAGVWSASPALAPGTYDVTPRARDRVDNSAVGTTITIVVAA